MAIIRNAEGKSLFPVGKNYVAEDTSFIAGDSPAVIDVNAALGQNGNWGYFKVDGTGDILMELMTTGSVYSTQFTLKSGEVLNLQGLDIKKIRLTHSGTNSSYRLNIL